MKRRRITADELIRELEDNPEYMARINAENVKLDALMQQYRSEQSSLLCDLADFGVRVTSVWDLVNGPDDYDIVLPVLARHLKAKYSPRVLEGIIRALKVPAATRYLQDLRELQHPGDAANEVVLRDVIKYLETRERSLKKMAKLNPRDQ